MAIVFAGATFLGAFLLFQVQPLIAKYILPWFGGTPAVWTTCMLFFQVMLLGGYAYAHGLVRRLDPRAQSLAHIALLAAGLILLAGLWRRWGNPILPGSAWKPPDSEHPAGRILLLLLAGIGAPYGLLAATSPLLQAWFSRRFPGRSPYALYTLSNAGSLLALLSYPVVIEPFLPLAIQAEAWAGLFGLYSLGCAACAWAARGAPAPAAPADGEDAGGGIGRRLTWLGLAACSAALLLATTNQMCQEVAVVPFLWVLPLSLYLFSFILCFAGGRWYIRSGYVLALIICVSLACLALFFGSRMTIPMQLVIFSLTLFAACMVCHGELVRLKPAAAGLTGFYLLIALGGALGGAAVTLAAPRLFAGFWEYHAALFTTCAMAWLALSLDPACWINRRVMRTAVGANLTILGLLLIAQTDAQREQQVYASRNFYGVLRVREWLRGDPALHLYELRNGVITHGLQFIEPARRHDLAAYYNPRSGVALAITNHPRYLAGRELRIGVIGLGVGTLAALGRAGDTIRFYEINPEVIRLAQGAYGYFSFLSDTPARIEIVPGDARLALEQEASAGTVPPLDVLVVDAFTSDSIPIHLLTREAWALYLARLKPDGVLALHISNRHLNLHPIVKRLADDSGLSSELFASPSDTTQVYYAAHWFLATRDPFFLYTAALATAEKRPLVERGPTPLWTDQHSDLWRILK